MTTSGQEPSQQRAVDLIPEPTVLAKTAEATDCKSVLLTGPYGARQAHSNCIRLGVIGTYDLVDAFKVWLDSLNSTIESEPSKDLTDDQFAAERHKLLFPDFPGAEQAFDCAISVDPEFEARIPINELGRLPRDNKPAYLDALVNLISEKIQSLLRGSNRKPEAIVVLLTNEMFETAHLVDLRRFKKPSTDGQLNLFSDFDKLQDRLPKPDELVKRNLRSVLKKLAMSPSIQIPIQIIRENTLKGIETQNLATRSWNLATGMYYKTGQLPWILGEMDSKTCFLGISFFHRQTVKGDLVFSSMSHLFANDFNSLGLRGERVEYNDILKSPTLTRSAASNLVTRALAEYQSVRDSAPKRLVIHKTSRYTKDELAGFKAALEESHIAYDLVSLTKASLRIIRWGSYPVPRGTAYFPARDQAYLYTKGFIPQLQTYPGSHIPTPFLVHKAEGDSSIRQVCADILSLTKLNWNTADFCCGVPVTISFARNVGEVFKEFDDSTPYEPSRYFRFYM